MYMSIFVGVFRGNYTFFVWSLVESHFLWCLSVRTLLLCFYVFWKGAFVKEPYYCSGLLRKLHIFCEVWWKHIFCNFYLFELIQWDHTHRWMILNGHPIRTTNLTIHSFVFSNWSMDVFQRIVWWFVWSKTSSDLCVRTNLGWFVLN